MLTIADGRKSFYQWDIGQGLTVTPGEGETITEVHIGLNGCKKYFVVEPVDGIVAVYDELLQKGDTFLVAYEYVKTADDGHTINKFVFKIIGRPKATDYAYTPTESHSWDWWCNQAKSYAEAAAESANQAETAAVSADASADRAEAKADSIKNMTVSAHAESGTEPTVTKTEEGGTFNLDFGLVRGEEGPEGPQGEPGPKGEDGRVTFEDVEPLLITDTASGAIASFPDGSGLDFISLKANIEPIQDLSHGAPSPENICPISGWDSVDVVVSPTQSAEDGETHTATFDETVYGGTVDLVSGVLTIDRVYKVLDGSDDEGWSVGASGTHYRGYTYALSDIKPHSSNTQPTSAICDKIETGTWNSAFGGTLVLGQTGKAIGFGLDSLGITKTADLDAWLANNPITIVYPLAEPRTIQLDPQTITTLVGENNVWADSGDSEVEYYANAKLYIDKKLGELS